MIVKTQKKLQSQSTSHLSISSLLLKFLVTVIMIRQLGKLMKVHQNTNGVKIKLRNRRMAKLQMTWIRLESMKVSQRNLYSLNKSIHHPLLKAIHCKESHQRRPGRQSAVNFKSDHQLRNFVFRLRILWEQVIWVESEASSIPIYLNLASETAKIAQPK